jgi:tetratricopeptide (TPR) repeat protein
MGELEKDELESPRGGVPPYWLIAVWLLLVLAAWPAIEHARARRTTVPADDLAASVRLFQKNQFADAIAAAQRHLQRDPRSAQALVNIGISSARLGKWDDAISATQRALLIQPDFPLAWNNLRWILAARAEASPTAEFYENQAFSLFQASNFHGCVDLAQRALKLYPRYTKAFNLLSVCYLNLGIYDDAIANAREALRIEPHFELARNNLSLAVQRKAQGFVPPPPPSPASPPATPATADAWLTSSLQDYRAGRMQQCIDDARAALKLQSNLAVAYNNIAACSNDLGRPDDAIAAATQALRLQPDFQLARNNMAVALRLKAAAGPSGK